MKETLPTKVTPIPSYLANANESEVMIADGATVRVRHSVAMISLALSMTATGLLTSKPQPVHAANSVPPELEMILPSGESVAANPSQTPKVILSESLDKVTIINSPVIQHEVKPGESLWQLARTYQTTPEAIASTNQIPAQSDLMIGQTLKIPTPEQLTAKAPSSTSEQLDRSSDSLRETRKRLQDSLVALRSQEAARQQNPSETVIVTETTAASPETGIEIPVSGPEESTEIQTERTIPIVVPTPENDGRISATHTPLPSNETESGAATPLDHPPIAIRKPENPSPYPSIPAPRVIVPSENTKNKVYRVRPGDSLNSIARRLKITPAALAKANGINNPNQIKVNQSLVVPERAAQRTARVNRIEISPPLAARPPLSFNPIAAESPSIDNPSESSAEQITNETLAENSKDRLLEDVADLRRSYPTERQKTISIPVGTPVTDAGNQDAPNPQWMNARSRLSEPTPESIIGSAPTNVEDYNDKLKIPVGETVEPELPPLSNPDEHLPNTPPIFNGYIWPTRGVLTSGYGWRWGRPHRGIDIAGPIGTPVVAAASGEVISSGWNSGGYGNLVKLKHADGSITYYAHNRRLLVRRGEIVEQGQQLAEMGSTGFSTGPHLHFEVRPEGQGAVNPIAFLPSRR